MTIPKWLEGWGDNVNAAIIDGELISKPLPLIKTRVLTLDEIFNNGGKFREKTNDQSRKPD